MSVTSFLSKIVRPIRRGLESIHARFLADPVLLFPMRVETRWDGDRELRIRWYPDESQLAAAESGGRRGAADGFAAMKALQGEGLSMMALPERIAIYTMGAFGGIEPVAETRIRRAAYLRYKWNPDDLRSELRNEDRANATPWRWVVDFEQAKYDGMAIAITDPDLVRQIRSAEWLLVLGVARGNTRAADVLDALSQRTNVALVDLHTPTNRAGDGSTRTAVGSLAAVERILGERATTWREMLARHLGWTPPSTVADCASPESRYPDLARCANTLLFGPAFQDLAPRGHLPPLRIADNPYGIALTHPSRWKYKNLRYAVSIARGTGRATHRPEIPASDGAVASFDDLGPLRGDNDVIRLFACMQQASVSRAVLAYDLDAARKGQVGFTGKVLADGKSFLVPEKADARAALSILLQVLIDIAEGRPVTLATPASPIGERILRQQAYAVRDGGDIAAYVGAARTLMECLAITDAKPDPAVSAAAVERLIMEALDAASNRFDAWFALRAFRRLRLKARSRPRIGVFGWIERPGQDLAPSNGKRLEANRYFQAPSLAQGRTVAVLGSLALSDETSYGVQLSSERVQDALAFIDALRNGATISEHLGFETERLLHAAGRDPWIVPLRNALAGCPKGDGRYRLGAIIGDEFVKADPRKLYDDHLGNYPGTKDEFVQIHEHVRSILDAFRDLAYAEAAHQRLAGQNRGGCGDQGRGRETDPDRASTWLDVADGEALPPEPEFVRTRRTGRSVAQRVALVFSDRGEHEVWSVRARLEPAWEVLCRNLVRDHFGSEGLKLELRATRKDDPQRVWSPRAEQWQSDVAQHCVDVLELVLDGASALKAHRWSMFARALADEALRCDALDALGLPRGTQVSELMARAEVEVQPASGSRDVQGYHARIANVIRRSAPLLSDDEASEAIALGLLRRVDERTRALSKALSAIAMPADRESFATWLAADAHRPSVGLLAGAVGSAAMDELVCTMDATAWEAARDRASRRLAELGRLCGEIHDGAVIPFTDATGPAGRVVFRLRLVRSADGAIDVAAADRAEVPVWRYVLTYVRDFSRRFQAALAVSSGPAGQDAGPPSIAFGRDPGSWMLFLLRIGAVGESLLAEIAGPAATALEVQPARERLAELVKTRFVRPSMKAFFAVWTPAAAARSYVPRFVPPIAALESEAAHTGYAHLFRPPSWPGLAANVGFTVDRWTDFVPAATQTTALVVNYEAPRNEAPNALLLCGPPHLYWSRANVRDAVANVVDVMRLRTLTGIDVLGNKLRDDFKRCAYTFESNPA